MRKFKYGFMGIVLLANVFSTQSYASENDMAVGIDCMPAKDFVKILGKLSSLNDDRTDSVSMIPKMWFVVKDGGALPGRVFFRHAEEEVPFHLNENGVVTDFLRVKDMHKDGEMCLEDKTRIGKDEEKGEDDEGDLALNIDMNLAYHNTSGTHSLAELKDGLDDGRAHIKKIAPAMVSFMIPKFTHLSVSTNDGQIANISAFKDGVDIPGLDVTLFEGMQIVEFSQLKELGADGLHITGAKYTLGPTPAPKDRRHKD